MSVVAPEMRSAWLPTRLERASRSAPAAGGRQLLSMHQHHPTCKGLTYVVDSAHHVALVALPPAPPWDVLPKKAVFHFGKVLHQWREGGFRCFSAPRWVCRGGHLSLRDLDVFMLRTSNRKFVIVAN